MIRSNLTPNGMTMKQIGRRVCEEEVESSGAMVILSSEGGGIDHGDGQAELGRGVAEMRRASGAVSGLAVPDQKKRGLAGLRLLEAGLQEPVVGALEGVHVLGERPEVLLLDAHLTAGVARERPEALGPSTPGELDGFLDEALQRKGEEQENPGAAVAADLGEEDVRAVGSAADRQIAGADSPRVELPRHGVPDRCLLLRREAGDLPAGGVDSVSAAKDDSGFGGV